MPRSLPFRFAFMLLLLCLACSACTRRGASSYPAGGAGASSSGSGRTGKTVQLFTPLEIQTAQRISEKEAAGLARKMNRQVQGVRSWRELDFPVSQSLASASGKASGAVAVDRPGLRVTYGQLSASLAHLKSLLPRLDSRPELLASEFEWYRLGPDFGITGYYEPTLQAARKKSAAYPYPLYRVPPDLKQGKPYHSRNAIDRRGALAGRGLEICWVSSEAEAFFLHIQGSGRLQFADGSVSHVLYAGKNNQAYVPLGRILRDEGLLAPDNINMQSIHQALKENPRRAPELFDKNPSYIFFRESAKGPYGAMGRPLTPWVSTATDKRVLPHGSVAFAVIPLPDENGDMTRPFHGLTLPQDVGGAIKGHRIDLFCGPGDLASHTAGYLNAKGAVYLLLKK